jgi:hypothetical protein
MTVIFPVDDAELTVETLRVKKKGGSDMPTTNSY